jgi:hypothetical protein
MPLSKRSVPRRVSTFSGVATPGGIGVEYLYWGFAGGPLSICALLAAGKIAIVVAKIL